MSLVGALTPLGKVARRRWLVNVFVFTIAGALASAMIGAALGTLGALTLPGARWVPGVLAAVVGGALAVCYELGAFSSRLFQTKRQTSGRWAKRFRPTVAAGLWGLDLGLTFTTWFTFAGTWLVVALALLSGQPALGSALLVSYWLGRAASVWIGPYLLPAASQTLWLLEAILGQYLALRRLNALGTAWLAAAWVFYVSTSL